MKTPIGSDDIALFFSSEDGLPTANQGSLIEDNLLQIAGPVSWLAGMI